MSSATQAIPEGFIGVTPHLIVKGAKDAIAFYKKALNAVETFSLPMPGTDMLMHAELEIGGARIMLGDEMPQFGTKGPRTIGGSPVTLHLYVQDVDAQLAQAEAAGGQVTMQPADMFWGDRYATFTDPFGQNWSLATHTSDPTPEEMSAAFQAMMPDG